jgi:hypothetical protein
LGHGSRFYETLGGLQGATHSHSDHGTHAWAADMNPVSASHITDSAEPDSHDQKRVGSQLLRHNDPASSALQAGRPSPWLYAHSSAKAKANKQETTKNMAEIKRMNTGQFFWRFSGAYLSWWLVVFFLIKFRNKFSFLYCRYVFIFQIKIAGLIRNCNHNDALIF